MISKGLGLWGAGFGFSPGVPAFGDGRDAGAGLPLGFFDDIYSGQPLGSAVLLWSAAAIVLDLIEARFPWRGFAQDWAAASAIIALYLAAAVGIANLAGAHAGYALILPQLLIALLTYPLVGRLVGAIDRLRLLRVRSLG